METLTFDQQVCRAGREINQVALGVAIEKYQRSGRDQKSDVADCVMEAGRIWKNMWREYEEGPGLKLPKEAPAGEDRISVRFEERQTNLSEIANKWLNAVALDFRQEVFGKADLPFEKAQDAVLWIEEHGGSMAEKEWHQRFEDLFGKFSWSWFQSCVESQRLEISWGSKPSTNEDEVFVKRRTYFAKKGSPLEKVNTFSSIASQSTGCTKSAAAALLLLGTPVLVSPVDVELYPGFDSHPVKGPDRDLLAASLTGGWQVTVRLRGILLSDLRWDDLQLAWRDIQERRKSPGILELVESLGKPPKGGKKKYWADVAKELGAPTWRAAMMRHRRAVEKSV